jgi:murein DD-endopeptidase MepM/ murein hydrolase activator NlpD
VASEDGVVVYRGLPQNPGPFAGGGLTIEVRIEGGATYVSCHCSGFAVGFGAKVQRGQTIAYVGSTGAATGPHDHFAVYTLDGYGRRLFYNPQLFMAGGRLADSPLIRPSSYEVTYKAYPTHRKALIAGGATVHRYTPSHTGGPVGPDYKAPAAGSSFWVDGLITYSWPGDSSPPIPHGEFLHGETRINPTTGKPYGGYFAGYGELKGEVSAADHQSW